MKVKPFKINTTAGARYGLAYADDTKGVLPSATAKWKTIRGAVNYANKRGYQVVKEKY